MSRHLASRFRKASSTAKSLAAFFDDWHRPHDDWQEYRGHPDYLDHPVSSWGWNPHHGEGHVAYSLGQSELDGTWGVTHHGFYRGTKIVHPEEATGYLSEPTEVPDFKLEDDGTPDRIGPDDVSTRGTWKIRPYRTLDEARQAAEAHFAANYGGQGIDRYDDLNDLMRRFDGGEL